MAKDPKHPVSSYLDLCYAVHLQHVVKYACSEEVPEPVDMGGDGFSVAFDPLDGSSIVDTNFAVGTIFGIWPGNDLVGITGRGQVSIAKCLQTGPDSHDNTCHASLLNPGRVPLTCRDHRTQFC